MSIKRRVWICGAVLAGLCGPGEAAMDNDLVIQPHLEYTVDTFENVSGGLDRDGAVMGLLEFGLRAVISL